ncbi:hypothetical protein GWI33_016301 [Rhynchophorus ferrugineus]|uniref:Uncharacterized protein n=1 Tax=Rhynchophorus ferrugineus TaxID=354439 RepID=A0A834M529_RHYFE|nr:hypothetical protein GWI33_016301 [Rhynchophorus ferrugineus]
MGKEPCRPPSPVIEASGKYFITRRMFRRFAFGRRSANLIKTRAGSVVFCFGGEGDGRGCGLSLRKNEEAQAVTLCYFKSAYDGVI